MSWHGVKPVTKERGEKLVAKYNIKYPENRYRLEPIEPLPPGECAHVTDGQSCTYCQPHTDELELI